MKKLICVLSLAGLITLGLSGLALADAPAADYYGKNYTSKGRYINYPAYLYPHSYKGQYDYAKYVRPAKGYNFEMIPRGSFHHVSEW